jgi:hypothetical protein
VRGDGVQSLDVPVGLLGLRLEVDAVGHPRAEQFDRLGADLLRQVILGLEYGDCLLTRGDGSSISRPAYSAKRGRWAACGVESSRRMAPHLPKRGGWTPFKAPSAGIDGGRSCLRTTPPPSCSDTWTS